MSTSSTIPWPYIKFLLNIFSYISFTSSPQALWIPLYENLNPLYESHVPTMVKKQLGAERAEMVGTLELQTVMKGAGPILQQINMLAKEGKKLIIADAVSIVDIEQIVLAVQKSDLKILPVGTASLAQVLGNFWLPPMEKEASEKRVKKYLEKYDSNVGYALYVIDNIKKDDYARLNTGQIVKVKGIKEVWQKQHNGIKCTKRK